MTRGKIQMRKIENATSRQVTFSKRRNGLLKKARELSILCDAEVAVIIFSQRGGLFEFSSNGMRKTIDRYCNYADVQGDRTPGVEQYIQQLRQEAAAMAKKIELLKSSNGKLLGQCLDSCSFHQLKETENQLERSLSAIRARKVHMVEEQIDQLKATERLLLEENAKLSEKCVVEPWSESAGFEAGQRYFSRTDENEEVETQLFIGPP